MFENQCFAIFISRARYTKVQSMKKLSNYHAGYKLHFLTHAGPLSYTAAMLWPQKHNRFEIGICDFLIIYFTFEQCCWFSLELQPLKQRRAREVYLASSKQDAETSSNNRKDDKLIIYNGILLYKWKTDLLRHTISKNQNFVQKFNLTESLQKVYFENLRQNSLIVDPSRGWISDFHPQKSRFDGKFITNTLIETF